MDENSSQIGEVADEALNRPMISAVMINTNDKYFPRMCIEAFARSKVEFPMEFIVVDHASTDPISTGYVDKAEKEGRIRVARAGANLGFAKGNNLGAKLARGKYILIINPDVALQEDTLQKMVDYMEAHSEVGVLGPKLVYPNDEVQDSCRREMTFTDLVIKRTFLKRIPSLRKRVEKYTMNDFDHSVTQEVELLVGALLLIPRSLYEQIGGFDERYFLFMEDFDLSRTIRGLGKKAVYFHETFAVHNHKRLSGGLFFKILFKKTFWIHVMSAFKYFWKWRKA
ncbi:glycosyltransferase family 2 protein [Candidatus Peregrinibacteria bacterium]|jgi:GT2 family glycosyltransferase|nr:glycosyltransferase family 2 protein [Candidatus Peregrinibacteria bacterium]MBT4056358.1 glycosyltransferase family 2 protein [Candidatus Peregrinibacteria bacterium]